ncbi:hypothetical protein FQA39_LY05361 [Lamprigera yunnana]|nr:hypothetical protein FQA39_LY05361 [Lamprigera yunnana]
MDAFKEIPAINFYGRSHVESNIQHAVEKDIGDVDASKRSRARNVYYAEESDSDENDLFHDNDDDRDGMVDVTVTPGHKGNASSARFGFNKNATYKVASENGRSFMVENRLNWANSESETPLLGTSPSCNLSFICSSEAAIAVFQAPVASFKPIHPETVAPLHYRRN